MAAKTKQRAPKRRRGIKLKPTELTPGDLAITQRGFTSPYLKAFVVARINPLRFVKGDLPSVSTLLAGMTKRVQGMKLDKIRPEDVARSGGVAADESE